MHILDQIISAFPKIYIDWDQGDWFLSHDRVKSKYQGKELSFFTKVNGGG